MYERPRTIRRLGVAMVIAYCLAFPGCGRPRTEPMTTNQVIPHAFRLAPGDDLKSAIVANATQLDAGAACILSAVGSLSTARIRFAGRPEYDEIVGDLEIVSLVGTLGPDGPHLHLAVADADGRTIGGHMGDGCIVRTTAEVVIGVLPGMTFRRVLDPKTGYRELSIESEQRP